MKTFKRIGFALFAMCLVLFAVSCNNDDSSDPKVVMEWDGKNVAPDDDSVYKLTAYDDNSFVVNLVAKEGSVTVSKGTYELINNGEDGANITETECVDIKSESGSLKKVESPKAKKVSDLNKFTLTSENGMMLTFTLVK